MPLHPGVLGGTLRHVEQSHLPGLGIEVGQVQDDVANLVRHRESVPAVMADALGDVYHAFGAAGAAQHGPGQVGAQMKVKPKQELDGGLDIKGKVWCHAGRHSRKARLVSALLDYFLG